MTLQNWKAPGNGQGHGQAEGFTISSKERGEFFAHVTYVSLDMVSGVLEDSLDPGNAWG